jgi:hypothetical protein
MDSSHSSAATKGMMMMIAATIDPFISANV